MSGGLTVGELALVAGGATAAGAGINAYSQNQTLRRQDDIAAQGIRQQGLLQSQANAGVQKTIQKVGAGDAATEAANKSAQTAQYLDALRRAAPVQDSSLSTTPGSSSRYAKDVVDARASNSAFGANQADLMARTDAPQLTQLQNQQTIGDEATKLGLLADTSSNQNNLTKLKVGAVQTNPWLTATSALLGGVGSGLSTYAGGMKPKPNTTSITPKIYSDTGLGTVTAGLA